MVLTKSNLRQRVRIILPNCLELTEGFSKPNYDDWSLVMITVRISPPSSEIQYTSMVFFPCLFWNTVLIWSLAVFFVLSTSTRAESKKWDKDWRTKRRRIDRFELIHLNRRLNSADQTRWPHLSQRPDWLWDKQNRITAIIHMYKTNTHTDEQDIPSVCNSSRTSSPSIMRRTHTPWLESKESLRPKKNTSFLLPAEWISQIHVQVTFQVTVFYIK